MSQGATTGAKAAIEPEVISVDTRTAARLIGVDPKTLANWRGRPGSGPAFSRMGRHVVYQVRDLEAFVRDHRVEA